MILTYLAITRHSLLSRLHIFPHFPHSCTSLYYYCKLISIFIRNTFMFYIYFVFRVDGDVIVI